MTYRLEWSARTCLSVEISCTLSIAAATALALYIPTQHAFNSDGSYAIGPPFAVFVCVIVKDNTLGGTISNSWGCLYGSFLACFVCYIFQSLIGKEYSPAAAIPILLFSTFIFNYIEFHMMGKKLGLSILALNLLTNSPAPALINWILFYNVLMGIFTAWIGNLLPFPRLACDEFVKRTEFCAEAIGDIIIDLVVSWRYACVPYSQIKSQVRKSRTHSSLMGSISVDPRDTSSSTPSSSSTQLSPLQHSPHAVKQNGRVWRLLRNVILACLAFRSKKTDACWTANHIHHKNNVFMRLEMVNFIEDIIAYLQTLKMDARFGPSRWIALERYDLFLLLLKDFIIVVNIFERRLRDLRHNSEHHDVVLAFQNRPTFRAAVLQYADSLALAIKQAALWLHDPRHTVTTSCNTGMMQLKAARDVLDKEYIDARVEIYYNEDPEKSKQMSSFVAMNQNSFMFLLDASFLLLDQYWSVFRDATSASSTNSWLSHLRRMAESIFKDLFPPQKHLFTLTSDHKLTQVMKMRLYQSLSLAISMCLAGIYGFFASRQQIFMAAFTIAYLTGGAVSGANAVTSMNRATGTVAGSVFAVIIAYIVKGWASHSLRSFFIGVMVVLWQFPCTYVRTMPIYGYAGTVAGFTAPVLLLMPSINEQQAVDRIIDTYVGVLLFVIVDFTIAPAYTDDALLTDIRSVFRGIRHHFSEFIGIFKAQSVSTRGLVRRSSIIKDITHGRDISVYASIFPVPWRPPPLEKRIVDELISGQETAHRSIQGMMWALIACNRGANTDFTYLLRPLRDQLDRVSEFVDTVSTHLQSNADHMTAWNKVKNEWKGCPTKTLINGEYCDDIYTSVLTNRVALLSTGDEESEEVRELFACIEHLIRQLQTTYRETSSSFSEVSPWNSHEARLEFLSKEIISNEEVKAVNSVLCCMKDLLEALKSISASMTRLRAYRDIRLTQSGVRAVKTKKL